MVKAKGFRKDRERISIYNKATSKYETKEIGKYEDVIGWEQFQMRPFVKEQNYWDI